MASPWPDLPPELLARTLAVLGPRDRVAAGLVCASWRAGVRDSFPSDLPFEAPRLLHRRPGAGGRLAFFSLEQRKLLAFPAPGAGRCCGHTGGWLAMVLDADRSLVLCHIASGRSVAVPSPPVFPVSKVVLSGAPTSPGWVAAALGRTGMMALLRAGGSWMTVGVEEAAQHGGFKDVAFWSGRLCALGNDGAVLAFRWPQRAAVSVLREAANSRMWALYLVEGDGELLLVRRLYTLRWGRDQLEMRLEVQALESAEDRRWGPVEETPGRAVLVGSVASAVVPVSPGLRESCVYLTRRQVEMLAPHAICEYSLADGEMTSVPIAGGHSTDVEPVWITPFV